VIEDEGGDNCGQCTSCMFVFCSLCREGWHPGSTCLTPERRLAVLQAGGSDSSPLLRGNTCTWFLFCLVFWFLVSKFQERNVLLCHSTSRRARAATPRWEKMRGGNTASRWRTPWRFGTSRRRACSVRSAATA
jgi:hypothetical protein